MLRIPPDTPENQERAATILKFVQRERMVPNGESSSVKRISRFVHEVWELRDNPDPQQVGVRSLSLRKENISSGVIDHPVPSSCVAKILLSLPREDHRVPYVLNLLRKYAFFCLLTTEEKQRLENAGIADGMPSSWNKIDRYARYLAVGISIGEEMRFGAHDLRGLLMRSPAPFYVYRLLTPSNYVFYIGKGEKFRALSHEKELFNKTLRTHTNWKKLNKIAKILHSGKQLVYEIESWHLDEIQAFLREDELILMAERDNPWLLTNSNGRRWAGKPSREMYELRKTKGIDTWQYRGVRSKA